MIEYRALIYLFCLVFVFSIINAYFCLKRVNLEVKVHNATLGDPIGDQGERRTGFGRGADRKRSRNATWRATRKKRGSVKHPWEKRGAAWLHGGAELGPEKTMEREETHGQWGRSVNATSCPRLKKLAQLALFTWWSSQTSRSLSGFVQVKAGGVLCVGPAWEDLRWVSATDITDDGTEDSCTAPRQPRAARGRDEDCTGPAREFPFLFFGARCVAAILIWDYLHKQHLRPAMVHRLKFNHFIPINGER